MNSQEYRGIVKNIEECGEIARNTIEIQNIQEYGKYLKYSLKYVGICWNIMPIFRISSTISPVTDPSVAACHTRSNTYSFGCLNHKQ